MPARPLTRRAEEMLKLIREIDAGAEPASVAAREGVQVRTLGWWRSQLRSHLANEARRDFVEVRVKPKRDSFLRVGLGEMTIDVPSGFDAAELGRLIETLRGC